MRRLMDKGMLAAMAAAALIGCTGNTGGNNGGTGEGGTTNPDATMIPNTAAATCADPVVITRAGTRTTLSGTTAGKGDNLEPYGGCVESDGPEAVFKYTVPSGVQAVRISTNGSGYDTALYVRSACSQAAGGNDTTCNNDSFDGAPGSTIYLSNVLEGSVHFIVVDGVGGASGSFTLDIEEIVPGTMGSICRPEMEGNTMPRCDAPAGCSPNTGLCVATVAVGAQCDQQGFQNTCAMGSSCVSDPSPVEGMPNNPTCRAPGTAAGSPCRMEGAAGGRCDAPLTCGMGDSPVCVRVLTTGASCDPMGSSNACPEGQVCSPVGGNPNGPPVCHAP